MSIPNFENLHSAFLQYGPRYDWSAYEQGLLLGAFYYVYPIASVPCGLIQDRYGIGREFIAVAFAVTAILCAISPLAAAVGAGSFGYLFAVRLLMGIAQGGTFSNLHRLVSRWAPRDELGTFAGSIIGSNVGTMLTWAMSGAIIESWGWQWSFHVAAMLVVVFVAVWWYAVYDSPAKHPRITLAEREYIENNLAATTSTLNKDWPPFGRMLTSCAFWALVGIQFANDWGLYFVITGVPRFLNQVSVPDDFLTLHFHHTTKGIGISNQQHRPSGCASILGTHFFVDVFRLCRRQGSCTKLGVADEFPQIGLHRMYV